MMLLYLRRKNCFVEMIHSFFGWYEIDKLKSKSSSKSYYTISPVHLEVCRRIATVDEYMVQRKDGVYLDLSDKIFMEYFNKGFSEEQFFCVIFAHWYGLSENQIKLLSNKNNCNVCEKMLAYFLCNPQSQDSTRKEVMNEVKNGASDLGKALLLFEDYRDIENKDVQTFMTVYRVNDNGDYGMYTDINNSEQFFDVYDFPDE